MAVLTQHAPGTFSWPELSTTDPAGAKKFYGALFGWTGNDVPMGPDAGSYTLFQKGGQASSAMVGLSPDQQKMGIPPHWGAYVTVADADATTEKAKQLGGTVLAGPFDVMGTLGRMAVIQDPTGATFCVWQAKDHIGAGVLDEPGALAWTELMTSDPARSKAFYTALIGWSASEMPMDSMMYTLFNRPDGIPAGGMMEITPEMGQMPSHWLSYFQVADIEAAVALSAQMGGTTMLAPKPVPGVGKIAILADPQGAAFGLLEAAS